MNVSAQTLNNWETRGISENGALLAQARYAVDANWLLDDANQKRTPPPPAPQRSPLDQAVVDATHVAMRSYYKTKHQDYPEEVVARFLLVYAKLVLRKAGVSEAELLSAELHDITAQGEIGDGGSAAGVRGKGDHARTVARRVRKA